MTASHRQTATTHQVDPRGLIPPDAKVVEAQAGPQLLFLSSQADIAIYGGSAGSGKTFGLLLECLRYLPSKPGFDAAIFRRTTPQITNPGALWDESLRLLPNFGGIPTVGNHEFKWPAGGKLKLAHMQFEETRLDWLGAQLAFLGFDQLEQFTPLQFWTLVGRNRSTCGVRPYTRATCNPDPDSFVADLISWWIDPESGFPIQERAGVIRYVMRGSEDRLVWGDTPEEVLALVPRRSDMPDDVEMRPKSVTFVPGTIFDNAALMRRDPDYLASLLALPLVERERLLGGNWKIRPSAGLYFRRGWVEVVDAVPAMRDTVRYWDLAATEKTQTNDPDWTVGVKMGRDEVGCLYVLDVVRARVGPFEVEQLLKNTASQDGKTCKLGWGKDPGQAGKSQTLNYVRMLVGYWVMPEAETGDKITRFGPMSAQCRAGNVKFLRGPWNEDVFRILEGFPDLAHDDDVDAFSGAGELLVGQGPGYGVYEYYRREADKLAAAEAAKRVPKPVQYAPGSLEWQQQQQKGP